MQDIRLVALDLDDTVFDSKKHITPRTRAAMRAALDKGVLVIPATGRTASGVPKEFSEMPGVDYLLTSNGASVVDQRTGRKLVHQPFAAGDALAVYEALRGHDGMISIFVDGEAYFDEAMQKEVAHFTPPALRPYLMTRRTVPELGAYVAERAGEIEKFSIMYPDLATRDAAWAAVTAACEVEATTSMPLNLELNAPGVNKGSALLALAGVLGLRPAQVMACGDSGNDLEMVRMAGLGVAMENATDAVKAVADYITADNNHDGVALAIEKFVL